MTLIELLGITSDNLPDLQPLTRAVAVPPCQLADWFEAPYAAHVVYDYWADVTDQESAGVFAAMVDLFSGAFWRRAGWGKFQLLAYHSADDVAYREWAEQGVWVTRDSTLGWVLKTAPYRGGMLGLVESDHGPEGIWFRLDYKEA